MENRFKVGNIVFHRNPAFFVKDIVSGPGTILSLKSERGVDAAEVFWQKSGMVFHHRLDSLLTLSEKEIA